MSSELSRSTPKFFEAKVAERQEKMERVFRKNREERLQGREVMDVIVENSKDLTGDS